MKKDLLKELLMPYQEAWIKDDSRFKIGLWSRQTGKSFATACEAVGNALVNKGTHWVVLSAGERQALEWMEKAKQWAKAYEAVIESYEELRDGQNALIKAAEIRFANQSRITAIPANPATARGYSANLVLDEFAIHERPFEIWAAIYPSITNPLNGEKKLRIVSTPKGRGNKFADLWEHNSNYSKHKVTIEDAVRMGLPVNLEELRNGVDDPDIWAQEYMCEFIDNSSVLLPYELIGKCETDKTVDPGDAPLFVGMDIGRAHDLSVIVTLAKIGDVLHTVEVEVLNKMPFADQLDILVGKARASRVHRVSIDASGIGAMLAEEARRKLGGKVEEFKFTNTSKNDLFQSLRRTFDDRTIRIPVDRDLCEDLHAIQKNVSTGGNVSYSAPRSADGHSDRASALALAIHASRARGADIDAPIFSRRNYGFNYDSMRI